MKEIKISTGMVEYSLNGVETVSFNPTDPGFIERLFQVFDALEKKQETLQAEVDRVSGDKEVFEVARKRDDEMRSDINSLFGKDICTPLFGTMNVYAMSDGLPVWANLILSFMDEIDTTMAREEKAANPKLAKYQKKYLGRHNA